MTLGPPRGVHNDSASAGSSAEQQHPVPGVLRRGLSRPVKKSLLAVYWRAKAFKEDLQDFLSEIIGYLPSHSIRALLYRVFCGVKLGRFSSIHRRCRMYHPSHVWIGNNTVINYGVLLDGRRGLVIGDNVSISEGTAILTLEHDLDDPDFKLKGGQVVINDRVFIGSYARILPGVILGEGAVVGVGSVVTKDVAPYTVVGGAPARYIRDRSRDLHYKLHYRKRLG